MNKKEKYLKDFLAFVKTKPTWMVQTKKFEDIIVNEFIKQKEYEDYKKNIS